jgi:hydroxymethylpyrimidine pyrophosphatase-like HAD family hydrolase
MQNLFFVDLDDTLFQTLRKCDQTLNRHLTPRAFLKNGDTISYATPKQNRLWEGLSNSGMVVPVTARNFDAFSRVNLTFQHSAILNHGAVILNEQRGIDLEWQAYMAEVLPPYHALLLEVWELVEAHARDNSGLRPRLIEDFGVCWYGVVKHADAEESPLQALSLLLQQHAALTSGRLYCHLNGNNLAIIPAAVTKANAVRFLLERYTKIYDAILSVGIGDSKTDQPFMSLCDYALIPGNTQLGALFRDL